MKEHNSPVCQAFFYLETFGGSFAAKRKKTFQGIYLKTFSKIQTFKPLPTNFVRMVVFGG